jgi:hypothetical protein
MYRHFERYITTLGCGNLHFLNNVLTIDDIDVRTIGIMPMSMSLHSTSMSLSAGDDAIIVDASMVYP